jgi:putative hydrolase of the HAD superfamily
MVKGYCFDYGGTLDTGGQHWGKVLWHAYEHFQVPVTEQQFREAYVHAERTLGKKTVIQSDFTFRQTLETKLRLQFDYLKQSSLLFASLRWQAAKPSPPSLLTSYLYAQTQVQTAHSCHVLHQLHQDYPMVLVSNFYGNMAVVLQEFGFDGLFREVIESAVVGVRKPDPRIFTLGVEALGLKPEEVVVVGDSMDKDIIPAKQAGCQTVWLKGEGWTNDPMDESIPDRTITDLSDLLET